MRVLWDFLKLPMAILLVSALIVYASLLLSGALT